MGRNDGGRRGQQSRTQASSPFGVQTQALSQTDGSLFIALYLSFDGAGDRVMQLVGMFGLFVVFPKSIGIQPLRLRSILHRLLFLPALRVHLR